MTNEILLEQLLEKATSPKVVGSGSIFEGLQEANKLVAEAEKILSVLEKYKLLEPMRLYFYKKNELDKVQIVTEGIKPASKTHELAFIELNKLTEQELIEHGKKLQSQTK
jgi:hypothetical protein